MADSHGGCQRAARYSDPAEVGSCDDVNPVGSWLVNQAIPDRDFSHGLGEHRDENEGHTTRGDNSDDAAGNGHECTRPGRLVISLAASAIVSSRISSSE